MLQPLKNGVVLNIHVPEALLSGILDAYAANETTQDGNIVYDLLCDTDASTGALLELLAKSSFDKHDKQVIESVTTEIY